MSLVEVQYISGIFFFNRIDLVQTSFKKYFEISAIELLIGKKTIMVLSVHSPSGNFQLFLETLERVLNEVCWKYAMFPTGDSNIDLLDHNDNKTVSFCELLNSYGMSPTIFVPTRLIHSPKHVLIIFRNIKVIQ